MAIPTRIHVPRFIAACFGLSIKEELTPEQLKDAAMAVGTAIGASPDETASFWQNFQGHMVSIASRLADGNAMLSPDRLIEEQMALLSQWFKSLGRERGNKLAIALEGWLQSKLVVSAEDFNHLIPFLSANWSARCTPDALSRLCILTSKNIGQYLFLEHPTRMKQVLKVWSPFPYHKNELLNKAHLQAQGRIARKLFLGISETSDDPDVRREALENIVRAWHEAYETTIFNVCLMFWLVKRKPGKAVDPSEAPKNKGLLYDQVVEWFASEGLGFPFYEKLPWVRNPSGHSTWVIDDKAKMVLFMNDPGDPNKNVEMPFDDIGWNAFHDIVMASMFPVGIVLAMLMHMNERGAFDAAWERVSARLDVELLIDDQRDLEDDLEDDESEH